MTTYVITVPDAVQIDLDSLPVSFTYTGSNLTALTVTYLGKTYVQTLTYSGSNVTAISAWELQ